MLQRLLSPTNFRMDVSNARCRSGGGRTSADVRISTAQRLCKKNLRTMGRLRERLGREVSHVFI